MNQSKATGRDGGCSGVQAGGGATLLEKCGKVRGKHQQRWDNLQMKGE